MTHVGFGGVLLLLRGGSGSERIRRQRLGVVRAALELLLLNSKSPPPAQRAVLLAQGAVFQARPLDADLKTAAALSVLAHLEHLSARGLVSAEGATDGLSAFYVRAASGAAAAS